MITNRSLLQRSRRNHLQGRASASGFTLIELLIVVAIGIVTTAIAVPVIQNSLRYYALRSAVSAVTGAIQSNRYNAIFHGCQYQVAFTASTNSYTVATTSDPAGSGTCLAALGTPSAAIPLPGASRGASLAANSTLVFYPSGKVTATLGPANPATLTLNLSPLPAETITVSNYGSVNVTP
jgi:prepilin-type N-terminal cleavage/methylation domain-containing protein